jgi:hypothetical protein
MSLSMKIRILATVGIALVLAIGIAGPASAKSSQPYTGGLSANSCAPGGSVHYKSDNTGQHHGTKATYRLTHTHSGPGALGAASVSLAADVTHTAVVGDHDQLSFTVHVPASAAPGDVYTLTVKAGSFSDSQSIHVIGVPASTSTTNLTWLWIAIGVVLLIAIVLLSVYLSRRRKVTAA